MKTVERDFFTVNLEKEEAHYPLARVLEVGKAHGGFVYVPVDGKSRTLLQTPGEADQVGARHLIRLRGAS